jgi:hypothetical protein
LRVQKQRREIIPLIILGLIAIALALYAVRLNNGNQPKPLDPLTYHPKATPAETKPSNPLDAIHQPPAPIPPSDTAQASDSKAITITSPTQGATVTSGTKVTGTAQVFEGTIRYRLKTKQNGVVAQGQAQVTGDSSQVSPYTFELAFTNSVVSGDQGTLEVYSLSAKDGTEINDASVGVYVQ